MSHCVATAQADLQLVILLPEPIRHHCPQCCHYRSVMCLRYLSTFGSVICFYCYSFGLWSILFGLR